MKACVVIPVYNSENLIAGVIMSVLQYTDHVLVVNDGSTDGTFEALSVFREQAQRKLDKGKLEVVSYTRNRGKGYALRQGFKQALELGYTHAVTMDADGQHLASDLETMTQAAENNPDALIVGVRKFDDPNMPKGNRFANKFSNFWFMAQTGRRLPDTQTGFRVYPLHKMGKMRLVTNRFEAELELLVRSAWRGIPLVTQQINVYYPPVDKRISHFRAGKDFFRISLLNTVLCLAAIVYGYLSMFLRKIFKL